MTDWLSEKFIGSWPSNVCLGNSEKKEVQKRSSLLLLCDIKTCPTLIILNKDKNLYLYDKESLIKVHEESTILR